MDKGDLVEIIEKYLEKQYFIAGKIKQCKREWAEYSTEKRYILKHSFDHYEYKNYLEGNLLNNGKLLSQYNNYLQKKWRIILENVIPKKVIKIYTNNGFLKGDITYRDFLLEIDEYIFKKCPFIADAYITVSHINVNPANNECFRIEGSQKF